jgi:demethylmenaquinone methyltransferase/2-methoxy-6-polyprenyl-1,4-benzoquinol methylase
MWAASQRAARGKYPRSDATALVLGGFCFTRMRQHLRPLACNAKGQRHLMTTPPKRHSSMAPTETVSFGYEEVPVEAKVKMVGEVFSRVAQKYDIMNDAMSGGMHRLWKDRFVRRVKPRAGEQILDMAGGTGDIAFRMEEHGASITVSDINPDMLGVGMERAAKRGIDTLVWSEQNAEKLSFPNQFFDAYTIAFGIRNVTDIPAALREAHRVLRYGGRFFCLEFSTNEWPGFAEVYDAYSHKMVPKLGKLIADDEDSYRYLIESIRRFPPMPKFAQMIGEAGFTSVKCEPIMGGLVAIHSGWKA